MLTRLTHTFVKRRQATAVIKLLLAASFAAPCALVAALLHFGTGLAIRDRVFDIQQKALDAALSAKYGVTVHHRHTDVWEIAGEPRQGTLTTGDTLLIGGRELALA